MNIHEYEHCCGAMILSRLGYSASGMYPADAFGDDPELHLEAGQPSKSEFIAEIQYYKNKFFLLGMFTIILDQIQQDILGPWLEEAGANLVATANNVKQGGHSPIYLYVIVLNELKED